MAIRQTRVPAGDNGIPVRFEIDDGDILQRRLAGIIDFLHRGIVFTILPGAGASVRASFSSQPNLAGKVENVGSPFTEDTVFHKITPFQSFEVEASGGSAEVWVLLTPRQNAKLEEL